MLKIRVVTILWAVALSAWLAGCLADSHATDPPAPAAPELAAAASKIAAPPRHALPGTSGVRVPIEQAKQVVVRDPARIARAFESGLIGRPPPALPDATPVAAASTVAQTARRSDGCNLPPGEPCDLPPPPANISVAPVTVDTVRLTYSCGTAWDIVRTSPSFARLDTNCNLSSMSDTGLQPGTTYCYALENTDGSFAAGPYCTQTPFGPYLFNGPGLSQTESDQMAALFDWRHTSPVATTVADGSGTHTALYSMNILVKTEGDMLGLRGLGVHTQTQPLLPDEQDAWDGTVMKAMAQGTTAGVWITAVVPGPVYNDLRSQGIAAVNAGHEFGIKAMVFRRINTPGAAFYPNITVVPAGPLNPNFIISQGLVFNGYAPVQCNGTGECTIEQDLLGWSFNFGITLIIDFVEAVVDGVRQIIGAIERLIVGDVDVTLQFVLNNSDEAFGTGEQTRSGWNRGAPLLLKNLPVRVYQGVAEFTGTTDGNGVATVRVAKNRGGRVCLDLSNHNVNIVDTFVTRRVCVGHFPATGSAATFPIVTTDKYANVLASMTDAADYLGTVMNIGMQPVSVLTGWQTAIATGVNGGRSFTPCMGRMPNVSASLALAAADIAAPVIGLLGEVSEFLNAYDIILDEGDVRSRGVGVHEYGHATMCELLRNTAGVAAGGAAWADVIVGALSGQDPLSQQVILAESFADFIALQVTGGTNYFAGSRATSSRSMSYCRGDSTSQTDCVEWNAPRCATSGASCTRGVNINWSAALLQDTFDRVPSAAERLDPPVNLPNDGSHWMLSGSILVPHHAANQIASDATEADAIQLDGAKMASIFSAWAQRGTLLRYDSFYGGLAQTLKDAGYSRTDVCALFASREPTHGCPGYVANVFGERVAYAWAGQPTAASYAPKADFSFNGTGAGAGDIAIHRSATGTYRVTFGGFPAWGVNMSATASVTAYGSSAITCAVGGVNSTASATDVDVRCWDNTVQAAADSTFSILLLGDSVAPSPSAFLASGGPAPVGAPSPQLSWTTGSLPMAVTHNTAAGDYNVNYGVGNAPMSAKLVTAVGAAGGERCNDAQGISGGIEVKCYDRAGKPADGQFYTAQIAGGRSGKRFGFAFANDRQSASYTPTTSTSFNSSGGAILATRSSVGHYRIDFTGLQKVGAATENVQVTAIGTTLVTCNVTEWSSTTTALQASVECRDGAGQFIDARYELMVIE